LAEVVKQALIADADLFEYIENRVQDILLLGESAMERLVLDCLRIKADIVSRDEREYGERRKLNFGHTVGHAVEQKTELTHGEAVSVGMMVAAKISVHLGLLPDAEYTRIINLLHRLYLPISFSTSVSAIIEALKQDKKREGDAVHFVLLNGIGRAVVKAIPLTELRELLLDLFKRNR
jgi:3-dehydroquinate synthase